MTRAAKPRYRSMTRQVIGADGKPRSVRVPHDIDGNPLHVSDTVQKVEWGVKAIHRLVKAVGEGEHITGCIMVTSSIAWESPRNYRKVPK